VAVQEVVGGLKIKRKMTREDVIQVVRVLEDSSLTQFGKWQLIKLFSDVVLNAPEADWAVMPTDDGSVTLEFCSHVTTRDLLFAVTQDSSVMYFTARGPNGFRKSGIVRNVAIGGIELAHWLVDADAESTTPFVGLG
jgi:hypothetical protein